VPKGLTESAASGTHLAGRKGDLRSGETIVSGSESPAAPVVFIVDDDPSTLVLLADIADDAGWQPRAFMRLRDLRDRIDREQPALIILDDDLPDGRGGDLARDLLGDPRLSDVAVLVCTAAPPRRRAEIEAWAPVIPKPIDLDELAGVLTAMAPRQPGGDLGPRRAG
jgi:DNA-binding response OmpR family regulator